jgi:hypothetical protein
MLYRARDLDQRRVLRQVDAEGRSQNPEAVQIREEKRSVSEEGTKAL